MRNARDWPVGGLQLSRTLTPTERSPWDRCIFLRPGRSASQHRGMYFPAFRTVRRCPCQSILTMQPKQGVRARHMSHQQVSTTLEKLVTTEAQEGTRHSTACLVRLVRYVSPHYPSQDTPLMFRSACVYSGLLFTCRALENMQADHTSELRACFKRSYDEVLRHHHGWFVQSAVTVRVNDACSESKRIFIFIFPRAWCSVGHHRCPLPIRILQADIPGGIP